MAKKKKGDYKKVLKTLSKNYWMIATIVLAILLLGTLVFDGASVSADEAADNTILFLNGQTGGGVELVSSVADGDYYTVTVTYQGQEIPLTVTKNGKNMVQVTPLVTQETPSAPSTPTPTEIPKSDKPTVDLFIWSYCPYGVMAQEPFAEVASLLEGSADFNAIMYHDGHGAYETQQNMIQACIQKLDNENYWAYAEGFTQDIYSTCGQSRDIDCDKTESITLMTSLGIDSSAIMSCVETEGETLVNADRANAQNNGVTGSPTILINGVKANVARNADAIKTAICSAYNEAPAECANVLDSTEVQAAGNC